MLSEGASGESKKQIDDILNLIQAPKTVSEIGIDCDILTTLKATKDIRDKYVLSRLAWDLGILDELAEKPYQILFIDGNHENFNALNSYPVEEWNGGKVHRIRKNILHLMRGQVFTIEGKTFFTMGGAYSIDKHLRKEGYSWWSDEKPNDAENGESDENKAE